MWRRRDRRRRAGRAVGPGGGKLAPYLAVLICRVEATPDITMPELAGRPATETKVVARLASLFRVLAAAGFLYRKSPDGIGVRTR